MAAKLSSVVKVQDSSQKEVLLTWWRSDLLKHHNLISPTGLSKAVGDGCTLSSSTTYDNLDEELVSWYCSSKDRNSSFTFAVEGRVWAVLVWRRFSLALIRVAVLMEDWIYVDIALIKTDQKYIDKFNNGTKKPPAPEGLGHAPQSGAMRHHHLSISLHAFRLK